MESNKTELVHAIPVIPDTGGFMLKIKTKKSLDFTFKNVRIKLNGDTFWKTLGEIIGSSIIATFRIAVHPITVTTDMITLNDYKKGFDAGELHLLLGVSGKYRVKQKTVLKKLNAIAQHGDPPFEFEFEYGEKKILWNSLGVLCKISTRASEILAKYKDGQSLYNPLQPAPMVPISTSQEPEITLSKQEMQRTIRQIVKVFPAIDPMLLSNPADAKKTMRDKARQSRITIVLDGPHSPAPERPPDFYRIKDSHQSNAFAIQEVKNPVQDKTEWEETEQMLYDLVEAAASLDVDAFAIPPVEVLENFEVVNEAKKEEEVKKDEEVVTPSAALRNWKKNSSKFNSKEDINSYYKSPNKNM